MPSEATARPWRFRHKDGGIYNADMTRRLFVECSHWDDDGARTRWRHRYELFRRSMLGRALARAAASQDCYTVYLD